MLWLSFNCMTRLKYLLTGPIKSTSHHTPRLEQTWKRCSIFTWTIPFILPTRIQEKYVYLNVLILYLLVGELQLCSRAWKDNSQVLPGWHRRAGPERWQRHTDPRPGVAADEKVKGHLHFSHLAATFLQTLLSRVTCDKHNSGITEQKCH